MSVMEEFKRNRTKLITFKDDSLLFLKQKNDVRFGIFTTEIEFLFRSGRKIEAKYISQTRLQFQEGMFAIYIGSKKKELSELTVDQFSKELADFGSLCDLNTTITDSRLV